MQHYHHTDACFSDKSSTAAMALRERCFRLGDWLVNPESNQISQTGRTQGGGREVRSLEPRIMLLLCALADQAGRVIRRDQLMDILWPRVVVNENSLTRAVSELRKNLKTADDSMNQQVRIETVPKTGYRLVANIQFLDADSARIACQELDPDRLQGWRRQEFQRPLLALAASLLLGLGLTLGLGNSGGSNPQGIYSQPGLVQAPSPDTVQGDIRLAESPTDLPVIPSSLEENSTTNVFQGNMNQPVKSPDGEFYAYVSYSDTGSSLMLGSEKFPSSPLPVYNTGELIYMLQWSPLDNLLLFAQKPRISPASRAADKELSSLLMFNTETMTVTVIHGSKPSTPDSKKPAEDAYSKLT